MIHQRRKLNFDNADGVALEVRRLEGGYIRLGRWSLPQICRHLDIAMTHSMRAGPHEEMEVSSAASAALDRILATGDIPNGIEAPDHALPPENTPPEAMDQLLRTLTAFKTFGGPYAPHPLFGMMSHEDFTRLHLIHCAHHLSFLVPTAA